MPMKINVGVCKKIGLPDYGSAGSHCDIELEMDFSVLSNPEEFQKRVQHAYRLCRDSVEAELQNHRGGTTVAPTVAGSHSTNLNSVSETATPVSSCRSSYSGPSAKQQEYIQRLSKGIKGLSGRRLDEYCQQTFGRASNQLSAQDASKLIDVLKDAKAGKELA